MENRTIINFRYYGDFWLIFEKWALVNNIPLVETNGHERKYKREIVLVGLFSRAFSINPVLVEPVTLKVSNYKQDIKIEAWIHVDVFNPILPSEMALESGGIRGAISRKTVRKMVNNLLEQLGQQNIP